MKQLELEVGLASTVTICQLKQLVFPIRDVIISNTTWLQAREFPDLIKSTLSCISFLPWYFLTTSSCPVFFYSVDSFPFCFAYIIVSPSLIDGSLWKQTVFFSSALSTVWETQCQKWRHVDCLMALGLENIWYQIEIFISFSSLQLVRKGTGG